MTRKKREEAHRRRQGRGGAPQSALRSRRGRPWPSRSYKPREMLGLEKMETAEIGKKDGTVMVVITGTEAELELPSLPRPGREVS